MRDCFETLEGLEQPTNYSNHTFRSGYERRDRRLSSRLVSQTLNMLLVISFVPALTLCR
jgi:hypothetical protein